jgi:hypothetical protein
MEDRKKKILEKLQETCQINVDDSIEQFEILEKQKDEISKYKSIAFNNIEKIIFP